MTAGMVVKKAGWVAMCLIGLTVGQLIGCWAEEVMVETRVGGCGLGWLGGWLDDCLPG